MIIQIIPDDPKDGESAKLLGELFKYLIGQLKEMVLDKNVTINLGGEIIKLNKE